MYGATESGARLVSEVYRQDIRKFRMTTIWKKLKERCIEPLGERDYSILSATVHASPWGTHFYGRTLPGDPGRLHLSLAPVYDPAATFPVGLHGLAEEGLVLADLAGVFGGFEGGQGEGGEGGAAHDETFGLSPAAQGFAEAVASLTGASLADHDFGSDVGTEEEGAAFDGDLVFGGELFEAGRPDVAPGSDVVGPDYGAYRLVVELGSVDCHFTIDRAASCGRYGADLPCRRPSPWLATGKNKCRCLGLHLGPVPRSTL